MFCRDNGAFTPVSATKVVLSKSGVSTTLHLDVLQLLSITLLPRILCLRISDQLRALLAPRCNASPVRDWMANNARLELEFGLHHHTILDQLLDLEDRQGLRYGDEKCIVSDITTGTYPATVAEGPGARVGLWGCVKEAFWAELHR